MNRRAFLETTASGAAQLALFGAATARPLRAQAQVEVWGRLEKLSDGVWALISTPLSGQPDSRRTLCNGGLVVGRNGVAVIEGFASDAGAEWMAGVAQQLAGRPLTHVILTHYHGDHSAGLAGYTVGNNPRFVTTETTRALLTGRPAAALAGAQLIGSNVEQLDLGGITLTITPRSGHTASDLSVAVADRRIVFCGDLLWNGLFPNYRDAVPSKLSESVRALLRDDATRVPGHGAIPTGAEAKNYVGLLDLVEATARRAMESGTPMETAAAELTIPASLGEWVRFNPAYYLVALRAWEKELRPG